jgi:hypothetical protein
MVLAASNRYNIGLLSRDREPRFPDTPLQSVCNFFYAFVTNSSGSYSYRFV